MELGDTLRSALVDPDPQEALRRVVIHLRTIGIEKAQILEELETLRSAENRHNEDIILDVMDFLTGFCSSHMRID